MRRIIKRIRALPFSTAYADSDRGASDTNGDIDANNGAKEIKKSTDNAVVVSRRDVATALDRPSIAELLSLKKRLNISNHKRTSKQHSQLRSAPEPGPAWRPQKLGVQQWQRQQSTS